MAATPGGLAEPDELGRYSAASVEEPLSAIMDKNTRPKALCFTLISFVKLREGAS
jgi:hypothetical protein